MNDRQKPGPEDMPDEDAAIALREALELEREAEAACALAKEELMAEPTSRRLYTHSRLERRWRAAVEHRMLCQHPVRDEAEDLEC